MDTKGLRVENRWRTVVEVFLDQVLLKEPSFCRCDKCRIDVIAIALNSLTPDYRPAGESFQPEEGDYVMVDEAVRKAVTIVKEAPRHDSGASQSILVNSNEDLARTVLADAIKHHPSQVWDEARLSWALAYILNEMGPKYTTTSKGDAYARVDEVLPGHLAEVYAIVFNALKRVEKESSVG